MTIEKEEEAVALVIRKGHLENILNEINLIKKLNADGAPNRTPDYCTISLEGRLYESKILGVPKNIVLETVEHLRQAIETELSDVTAKVNYSAINDRASCFNAIPYRKD